MKYLTTFLIVFFAIACGQHRQQGSTFDESWLRLDGRETAPMRHEVFLYNPVMESCIEPLQEVLAEMWESGFRFLVTQCKRTVEQQRKLVEGGFSKTMNSLHLLGQAFDIVPRKIPVKSIRPRKSDLLWNDKDQLAALAYEAKSIFYRLKAAYYWDWEVRTGMDWRCLNDTTKNGFKDRYHVEIFVPGRFPNCEIPDYLLRY